MYYFREAEHKACVATPTDACYIQISGGHLPLQKWHIQSGLREAIKCLFLLLSGNDQWACSMALHATGEAMLLHGFTKIIGIISNITMV